MTAAKLKWHQDNIWGLIAETDAGRYQACDVRARGYGGGWGAFFRPKQGRSRLPKARQPLGNVGTAKEAKMPRAP